MSVQRVMKRLSLTRPVAVLSLALLGTAASSASWGQSISLPNTILPEAQASQQPVEQVNDTPRADWRSGTYGPVSQPQQNPDALPPFGANLFTGGFRGAMGDGLNADYQVKPGDQITVRAWGAFEFDRVLPVDAQGNIFIPGSGPLEK